MGPTALLPLRRKCALRIFITHKSPPSSVGPEPATENPGGPMASMVITRLPRAASTMVNCYTHTHMYVYLRITLQLSPFLHPPSAHSPSIPISISAVPCFRYLLYIISQPVSLPATFTPLLRYPFKYFPLPFRLLHSIAVKRR
jgi:hypothetical protein